MSELDKSNLIVLQPTTPQVTSEPFQTRAISFKIRSKPENITAFRSTVKAYIIAGMPIEQIANAGDFLGEEVERLETDAPIRNGWQNKKSEVVEDDNQIFAWQSRGEIVTLDHQIASANPVTGNEMVIITKELSTPNAPQPTIDVVEGISVVKTEQETIEAPAPSHDDELVNSPFLKKV